MKIERQTATFRTVGWWPRVRACVDLLVYGRIEITFTAAEIEEAKKVTAIPKEPSHAA